MTTISQVKKLVKPLMDRNIDLATAGRLIFINPINHFTRGIYIDRCLDKNLFNPSWSCTFLFYPNANLISQWGGDMLRRGVGSWDVRNPNIQEDMMQQIEETALPVLRSVKTVEDLANFASDERFPGKSWSAWPLTRLIFQVVLGDLEAARATCTKISQPLYIPRDAASRDIHLTIVQGLSPLLEKDDRKGMAKLLLEWEAATVAKYKLEKYWQPTPFPVELQIP